MWLVRRRVVSRAGRARPSAWVPPFPWMNKPHGFFKYTYYIVLEKGYSNAKTKLFNLLKVYLSLKIKELLKVKKCLIVKVHVYNLLIQKRRN